MKRWLDKRKFMCECKFGSYELRPLVIVITSNFHPKEIWPKESDHLPIMDRCEIIHMDKLKKFDDSKKRKASSEAKRPSLPRQDALSQMPWANPEIIISSESEFSGCLACQMEDCICDILEDSV